MPELNVPPFDPRDAESPVQLLPVLPVGPWSLDVPRLRFIIDAAPLLASGALKAALRVAAPLNPLVLIVGSTLMT